MKIVVMTVGLCCSVHISIGLSLVAWFVAMQLLMESD